MIDQPILSDAEWALVVDLLLVEHQELPVEIRHASNSKTRDELHHRRDLVEQLLKRLRPAVAV